LDSGVRSQQGREGNHVLRQFIRCKRRLPGRVTDRVARAAGPARVDSVPGDDALVRDGERILLVLRDKVRQEQTPGIMGHVLYVVQRRLAVLKEFIDRCI
jgi:hypothetical protein